MHCFGFPGKMFYMDMQCNHCGRYTFFQCISWFYAYLLHDSSLYLCTPICMTHCHLWYLSRNVCPWKCDGCGEPLEQPYRMPCLSHFVGACCREAIFSERIPRQCPVESCDQKEISPEYEWVVDNASLTNR